MTDTEKILQKLAELDAGQKVLHADVTALKSDVAGMKGEISKISTLELNIEAFRAEQHQANEELLTHIIHGYDENAKEHEALDKRVNRIEKHLNLPPVK